MAVVGATPRSPAACREAMWRGACGRAGTSPNEISCGRSCATLAPVEILPRRREHLGLRLGERAIERRPGRLAVSPAAEPMRQLGDVHVAERAETDLDLAIRELAEQQGERDHWSALAKSNTSSAVAAASGATSRGPRGNVPPLTWWSMHATACDCVIARARSPRRLTSEMSSTTTTSADSISRMARSE